MKKERKLKFYFLLIAFGVLLYVIALNYRSLLLGVRYLYAIVSPFVMGSVIAFIINVPMRGLETGLFQRMKKKKARRVLCLLTTLFLLILVLWAVFTLILPEVYNTVESLSQRIPDVMERTIRWVEKKTEHYPQIEAYLVEAEKMLKDVDWKDAISQSINLVKNGVGGFVNTTIDIVGNVLNTLVNFGIGFVFAIYLLLQKEKLSSQCKQFLYAVFAEKKADEVVRVARLTNQIFSNFLSGQVVEAIILGTMFFLAMSIFGLPYAMLVGVLIAVTALIPIFGAFIGLGVGAFLILTVNPMQALWFVILFFVLQQIEGNLIYPNVVGNSIGLPGIWVLIAVSTGGSMFGVKGMILFIPTVSLIYTLVREFVKKRLEEKGVNRDKWKLMYATVGGVVNEIEESEEEGVKERKKDKRKRNEREEATKECEERKESENAAKRCEERKESEKAVKRCEERKESENAAKRCEERKESENEAKRCEERKESEKAAKEK